MASLRCENTMQSVYLKAHHRIGRVLHSVDTFLSEKSVSRIHAIIEWDTGQWKIHDHSRNGTWLNGVKLTKDQRYTLKAGDRLNFGDAELRPFVVENVTPPSDYLESIDQPDDNIREIISLKPYNLLPDEENPEIALYLDYSQTKWCLEPVNSNEFAACLVNEGELVSISNQRWKLCYNRVDEATTALDQSGFKLCDIHFKFLVSLDEESIQLFLKTPAREVDLGLRIHHYLTLTLARQKIRDIESGVDETEQGWIYTDLLVKHLGLAETHLNIQIHRARKQLVEYISEDIDVESFIQRRGGKVRLGVHKMSVIKGSQVESNIVSEVDGA